MSTTAIDSKQLVMDYFKALSGLPKDEAVVAQFVSDPALKEHVRVIEAGFPSYDLIAHQTVAEGDFVVVRGLFRGVHKGEFAGIQPTGKHVAADLMIMYRIADGLIAEHWLQFDSKSLMDQLTN